MDAERWARIDYLLEQAMNRPPEARTAFLATQCAGDDELRREVESLLDAHDRSESFLSTPAIDLAARHLAGEQQASLAGKRVGSYQVISLLGAGGMGEVYLARDERLKRKLTLKLLPQQFTRDADRVRRFEREARAASALNHPNIITIYDIGETAGTYFIAAEYVEGQTLRQLLERGPLRAKEAIGICAQIADALDAAHATGLVHRDIKPENVIVRPDGYVKVLDFGLVKLTERGLDKQKSNPSDPFRTNPGIVLGTVAYMSPEQASGIEVDHRSDLFSLGVVMYELLSGVAPFKGESTASIFDAIIHHQPESLASVAAEADSELERIVNRALEKDRDLRYQTASDFEAELKRLRRKLDSAGIERSGASSGARDAKPASLAISRPALAAVAAMAILAALSLFWLLGGRQRIEPSPWLAARFVQLTDFPHEESFPSLSPDGNTIVYARRSASGWDIFSQRVGGLNARNLTESFAGDDTQPAYSPDGAYIAFRSERDGGGIFVMGASGESIRRLSDRGPAYQPAWSPDSQEVIYTEERFRDPRERLVSAHRLWAVNIRTLEKRLVTTRDVVQPQWSPGGHRLAYWATDESSQRDIWTMDPKGENFVQATNDAATDWNPVWSSDGRFLYFVSDRSGGMQLWRVAIDERTGRTLAEPELVPTPSAFSQHISLSRDGQRLAFVSVNLKRTLFRVGFDPGREKVITRPLALTSGSRQGTDIDISSDGGRLVYNTIAGNREDLALIDSNGNGEPRWLTDDEFKDRGPRWSPDGKRIAFYSTRSGNFEIWLINADGTGLRRLTEAGKEKAYAPLWSPDGRQLVYTNEKGETWVIEVDKEWSRQTPRLLNPKSDPPLQFWPTSWSSDGKRLIGGVMTIGNLPVLTRYSFETGLLEKIADFSPYATAWLQDDRRAVCIVEGGLYLIDTVTGRCVTLHTTAPDRIAGFRISRDNRWLYYVGESVESDIWLLEQN